MNGRALFFLLCLVLGIGGGWWWSSGRLIPEWSGSFPSRAGGVDAGTAGLASVADTSGQSGAIDTQATQDAADAESSRPLPQHDTDGQPYAGMPSTAVISYHDAIMKVAPAVVSLYAGSSAEVDPDGLQAGTQTAGSQGSGVIVDSNGIVLTNLHLVAGLDKITVVLSDGRKLPAILIGSDPETDLAVVRVAAANLPFVRLDDAPPLRVGDVVLAIGNPFGVGQTVTQGIVSATRRRVAGGSVWQHFVQIDAAINPGNSGGALINPYGQLVGVNTAVYRGDTGAIGIGFSIPADLLVQVVPQIIEYGSVARGWLGIGVEELNMYPKLYAQVRQGAVVAGVVTDSPAHLSGLQPLDVIIGINRQSIDNGTQLLLAISAEPPDTPVILTILRVKPQQGLPQDGPDLVLEQREVTLSLGQRPTRTTPVQPR
ncbi:MAG: trypsin-like serine protease [Granulosicoccus sp.]|nr:trypsin-like serine protease [Granulosicoccus sp.]